MAFDVVFLHPPSVYDFRERVIFPGPTARIVPECTPYFISIPIGLVSIADLLDKAGYKIKIFNIAEMMVADPKFDVNKFLQGLESLCFGIDLHWCVHSQGSIEIAKLCKNHHPNSFIVLGGLTATYFGREIMQNYDFVDCIIKGEAEEPMLELLNALVKGSGKQYVPNLLYRDKGKIRETSTTYVPETLDGFDYSRIDLIEPIDLLLKFGEKEKAWSIPVSRGCIYNCATCGGSQYSYGRLMNRERPAFRSPMKIVEDLNKLADFGINNVFLFQDIRMGGRSYCDELFDTLRQEKPDIKYITLELFDPPPFSHLKKIAELPFTIRITISPESGVKSVREFHGREYSNSSLMKTLETCMSLKLMTNVFFMGGLAEQTHETMKETLSICERIFRLDKRRNLIRPEIGFLLLLEPGSLAFDYPNEYGYISFSKKFEDYYHGAIRSHWKDFINYETKRLSRENLFHLFLDSILEISNLQKNFDIINSSRNNYIRFEVDLDRYLSEEVNKLSKYRKEGERKVLLKTLSDAVRDFYRLKIYGSKNYPMNRHINDIENLWREIFTVKNKK
jgi:B12-binding domain/radical SAM domain protein